MWRGYADAESERGDDDTRESNWARGCAGAFLVAVVVVILAIIGVAIGLDSAVDFPDPEELDRRRAAEAAQFEREQRLVGNVDVEVEGCFPDGARGSMTNHNQVAFTTRVRAYFYDEQGQLLRAAAMFIELDAGETQEWALPRPSLEAALEEIRGYSRCEVRKRPDGSVSSGTWETVYGGVVAE